MAIINGTFLPDVLLGTGQDDTINGFGGADTIDGLGGNDEIHGGTGLDILTGGAGDDRIFGEEGDDEMYGDDGNDVLDGGTDAATLLSLYFGGAGNDLMIASNGGVGEYFNGGSGVDTVSFERRDAGVRVQLSFRSLPLIDTVQFTENVIGSRFADTITGDSSINVLRGIGGDDVLDGGAGGDVTDGGTGNDVHIVDNVGDVVIERAGEGNDRVLANLSYRLAADAEVELLSAANQAGTDGFDLAGNDFAQSIIGDEGENLLEGMGGFDVLYGLGGNDVIDGGTGEDVLRGGAGDDTYYVDAYGDIAIENAGEGTDRVLSTSVYWLRPGNHVELLAAANQMGTENIHLRGNEFNNQLIGNQATNSLEGEGGDDQIWGLGGNDVFDGGLGNDVLVGGEGRDRYIFSSELGANNIDTLQDFERGDHISLSHLIFDTLGLGPIGSAAFVIGAAAREADDRIIYDQDTGRIFYDADGSGAGAAIQFAQVSAGTVLTAGDFSVI